MEEFDDIFNALKADPVIPPVNTSSITEEEDEEQPPVQKLQKSTLVDTPIDISGILEAEELAQTTEAAATNDNTADYDPRIVASYERGYSKWYDRLKQRDEENYQEQLRVREMQTTGEIGQVVTLQRQLDELPSDDSYRIELETQIANLKSLNTAPKEISEVEIVKPVSYTHLTLPTNREV